MPGENPTPAFEQGTAAINKWLKEGKNVMVHCSAGLSRSVSIILAWIMKTKGKTLKEAVDITKKARGR